MLEVLYHHAEFGGAWTSPAARVAKKFCLCVYLSVNLLKTVCAHNFAILFEDKNDFDTVG